MLSCDLDIMYTEQIDQNAPFSENMFFNFPCKKYACNPKNIADIQNNYYDLIYVCSWHVRGYRDIARSRKGKAIRILCMDNQWMGTARQYIGIAAFRLYVRSCYDFAFVPGNRQAKFASYLGFGAHEIIEGHYACAESFTSAAQVVAPRAFLFVGRLIDLKGVNVLASAWRIYVQRQSDPWTLRICGAGPLRSGFDGLPCVEILGFVQPLELPVVMQRASALVLPSLYEPWGLVVQEAAKAGLGLIASSACGAADYFLRDMLNGRLVQKGNVEELCAAFEWFHQLSDAELDSVKRKSAILGAQRSPSTWTCAASRALTLGRGLVR